MGNASLGSAILVGILTRELENLQDPDMKSDLADEGILGEMKQQRPPKGTSLLYFFLCFFNQSSVTIFLLFDRIFGFGSLILGRLAMKKSRNIMPHYVHQHAKNFLTKLNEKFKDRLEGVN